MEVKKKDMHTLTTIWLINVGNPNISANGVSNKLIKTNKVFLSVGACDMYGKLVTATFNWIGTVLGGRSPWASIALSKPFIMTVFIVMYGFSNTRERSFDAVNQWYGLQLAALPIEGRSISHRSST